MQKMVWILLVFIFAFYTIIVEPNFIKVERLKLKADGLSGVKIVFISDLHLSKFSTSRLKRIIKKVNAQKADVVLIGGDYAVMHSAKMSMSMDKAARMIARMYSKRGIYSVLGNHDYFKDGAEIKAALEKYKIKVLENEGVEINFEEGKMERGDNDFDIANKEGSNERKLYLAGISDMQTTHYDLNKALSGAYKMSTDNEDAAEKFDSFAGAERQNAIKNEALASTDSEGLINENKGNANKDKSFKRIPVVLLSHSPDITPQAKGKADLVLAGHTHGGQVRLPLLGAVIVPSKYGDRYASGLSEGFSYTTRGLGTSVLHVRFNCVPEITVVEFE